MRKQSMKQETHPDVLFVQISQSKVISFNQINMIANSLQEINALRVSLRDFVRGKENDRREDKGGSERHCHSDTVMMGVGRVFLHKISRENTKRRKARKLTST